MAETDKAGALTARTYTPLGAAMAAPKAKPGLYLVATPIGNLGDVTLRALETLAGADVIACEDTRVTRKLADRFGIATPLTPYHEHNAAEARPKLLTRLARGQAVALVSDAGTPLTVFKRRGRFHSPIKKDRSSHSWTRRMFYASIRHTIHWRTSRS